MIQFNLHDILLIQTYENTSWILNQERNDLLELVFVVEGCGSHHLGDVHFKFVSRDILIIDPRLVHELTLNGLGKFYVLHFTEQLFSNKIDFTDRELWLRRIDFIVMHPELSHGVQKLHGSEQDFMWSLLGFIKQELQGLRDHKGDIIANLVSALLNILARNINNTPERFSDILADKTELIDCVLNYIHKNIYKPELTKISALAEKFNSTNTTLSNYFKKETSRSIHHYILLQRLELVKYRLHHTAFTVSQIASQMGFTDESHLTRIFKKYEDLTPRQYKDSVEELSRL